MPTLSQNLIFQTSTSSNSVSITYTTSTNSTVYSDKIKGDGYFGGANGLHTVSWKITNFVGTVGVQGTLISAPTGSDWVDIELTSTDTIGSSYVVDTTGLLTVVHPTSTYSTSTTLIKSYNFVGNFVWVRGKVSNWTQGTVNAISINR
jgi:hypothetical protein